MTMTTDPTTTLTNGDFQMTTTQQHPRRGSSWS